MALFEPKSGRAAIHQALDKAGYDPQWVVTQIQQKERLIAELDGSKDANDIKRVTAKLQVYDSMLKNVFDAAEGYHVERMDDADLLSTSELQGKLAEILGALGHQEPMTIDVTDGPVELYVDEEALKPFADVTPSLLTEFAMTTNAKRPIESWAELSQEEVRQLRDESDQAGSSASSEPDCSTA